MNRYTYSWKWTRYAASALQLWVAFSLCNQTSWKAISHIGSVYSVDVTPPALTSRSILVGLHYSIMQKTSLMFLERVLVQLLFTCGVLAYKLWTLMKLDVSMLEYRRSLLCSFWADFFWSWTYQCYWQKEDNKYLPVRNAEITFSFRNGVNTEETIQIDYIY